MTQESVSAVSLTEEQRMQIARGLVARARAKGAELVGPEGLFGRAEEAVLQTALKEELTDHLGYERTARPTLCANSRNGARARTVLTEIGPVQVACPEIKGARSIR